MNDEIAKNNTNHTNNNITTIKNNNFQQNLNNKHPKLILIMTPTDLAEQGTYDKRQQNKILMPAEPLRKVPLICKELPI